ncbi:hypothetical protein ACFX13_047382 [Malus domestica]
MAGANLDQDDDVVRIDFSQIGLCNNDFRRGAPVDLAVEAVDQQLGWCRYCSSSDSMLVRELWGKQASIWA